MTRNPPKPLAVLIRQALAITVLLTPFPATTQAQIEGTATTRLACEHLFIQVADGPHAAPYAMRVGMLTGSDLDSKNVQLVIQAANAYLASLSPLLNRASVIHSGLKAKQIPKATATGQLTEIDRQRDSLMSTSFQKLQSDLGSGGAPKFSNFLTNIIAPTYVVSPGVAAGCSYSTSFTMASDQTCVYATASMTMTSLCEGEAMATITAPDSTQSFDGTGLAPSNVPIVANARYAIGSQDGRYAGHSNFYVDGTDVGYGILSFGADDRKKVPPFVQLVRTSWSGNIATGNGSAVLTVVARTSLGCSGNLTMEAGLSHPTGAQVRWSPSNLTTQSLKRLLGAGTSFNFTFTATTTSTNTVTGRIDASSSIMAYPSACTLTGPDPGSGNSAGANTQIM